MESMYQKRLALMRQYNLGIMIKQMNLLSITYSITNTNIYKYTYINVDNIIYLITFIIEICIYRINYFICNIYNKSNEIQSNPN